MKKLAFVISCICCLGFSAKGQIVITSADMPAANDTPRVSYTIGVVDVTKTGANYSWNFDTLKSQRQTVAAYLKASKTPYSFYFSGDIGQKIADSIGGGGFEFTNVYAFYKNTSSAFSTVGEGFSYSSFPLASTYTLPDNIYYFPLKYGNYDSSAFNVKFSLFTIGGYSQTGYRITTVDGYGSIKTPFKTYDSCLRVHSVINEVDSIFLDTAKVGVPNPHEEYKWLVHGEVVPVLEVDGNTVGGVFVASNIIYRDSSRTTPLGPAPDFTANDTVVTTADTVLFTNNTTGIGNNFKWAITPNTFTYADKTTSTSANPAVNFTAPGKYTVSLTATSFFGKGVKTKTNYITVSQASGIDAQTEADHPVTIYPNPAKGKINIQFGRKAEASSTVEVYSMDGRLVLHTELPAGVQSSSLNLAGIPAGNYVLTIITGGDKCRREITLE